MATITPAYADVSGDNGLYAKTASYTMANPDTGVVIPKQLAAYADRTVQVAGTFGGATVTVQGSNDGTNFATLTDPLGNALTITTATIKQVTEAVLQMRPAVTGGDGTTALTVTFMCRRSLR